MVVCSRTSNSVPIGISVRAPTAWMTGRSAADRSPAPGPGHARRTAARPFTDVVDAIAQVEVLGALNRSALF